MRMNPAPIAAKKARSGNAPRIAVLWPAKNSGSRMQRTVKTITVTDKTASTNMAFKLNVSTGDFHNFGFHKSVGRIVKKKNGWLSVGGARFKGILADDCCGMSPAASAANVGS